MTVLNFPSLNLHGLSFKGRTVLITGASRGIGFGVAQAFAAAGADLHIAAENDAIQAAAADLGATGHQVDVTRNDEVAAMAGRIGAVDVLINNAGLELMTPLDDAGAENEAAFRRIIEINILGTFLVTRAVAPGMRAGGAIVNTASVWGRVAEPLFSAYVASKHAVIGLTKTWAKELGPSGIRVNAVCPGWVRTEASMLSLKRMAERRDVSESSLLDSIVGGQAMAGLMEPEDMADA